jgi:hypothetical protein
MAEVDDGLVSAAAAYVEVRIWSCQWIRAALVRIFRCRRVLSRGGGARWRVWHTMVTLVQNDVSNMPLRVFFGFSSLTQYTFVFGSRIHHVHTRH